VAGERFTAANGSEIHRAVFGAMTCTDKVCYWLGYVVLPSPFSSVPTIIAGALATTVVSYISSRTPRDTSNNFNASQHGIHVCDIATKMSQNETIDGYGTFQVRSDTLDPRPGGRKGMLIFSMKKKMVPTQLELHQPDLLGEGVGSSRPEIAWVLIV
jgi:hypothetical protein